MRQNDHLDDLDDLDRLVVRELQVLLSRLRRQGERRPGEAAAERPDADAAPGRRRDEAAPGREARPMRQAEPNRADNVVRAHPLARRPGAAAPRHMQGLFAPEEEAFLANAADWLGGRPNADILLDTLARRVLEASDPAAAPAQASAPAEDDARSASKEDDAGKGSDPEPRPGDAVDGAERVAALARARRFAGTRPVRDAPASTRSEAPGRAAEDPDAPAPPEEWAASQEDTDGSSGEPEAPEPR